MGMFFYDMYFIIIMIMLQGGKTHHLHADADAALRTASNRVSGVTTRHISSTVRIFRSEVVKADGHCGNLAWQSGVTFVSELHGLGSPINCLGRRVTSYTTRDAKEIAKLLAMMP